MTRCLTAKSINIFKKLSLTMLLLSVVASTSETAVASDLLLEEIIVTATRRAVNVQDIPFSITALSGGALEDLGADDLGDFAPTIAGLEFANFAPGLNRITMRGISTQTGESTVGFYIDEMPITADPIAQPNVKTFDANRVEILRGPQGTLFGEASMGGTVRIIMNQPDASGFAGAVQATVADVHNGGINFGIDGMVNVPIVEDKLALRIVGSIRENDGFIDNIASGEDDINDEELQSARVALAWTPNDKLKVTANFHHINNDVEGSFISNRDWEQSRFIDEPRDDASQRYNLTINYSLPWADFVSTTSYFTRDTLRVQDQTAGFVAAATAQGIPLPAGISASQSNDIDYDIFVQEARLVSTQGKRLDWLIGAFYKNSERTSVGNASSAPVVVIPAGIFAPVPIAIDPLLTGDDKNEFEQWAVFGELTFHITEQLHATAGVRYFEEENTFTVNTGGFFAGPLPFTGNSVAKADELTPRFSLQYDLSDDVMLYGTASKGFRTGGANPTKPVFDLFGVPLPATFEPDTLWNYEIGAKTLSFDGRLVINGAFYHIDWDEIQLPASAGGVFNGTFNAGSATSEGVELEITALPTDNVKLTFAGNYTDAELDENVNLTTPLGSFPVAIEGNELPLVPKWKINVGAEYRHPFANGWIGYVRGNASFSPERFNFADNNPAEELRSYQVYDLQLGLEKDRYEVVLFFDNLTNEVVEYAFQTGPPLDVDRFINPGKPRTIGVTARARF